MKHTKDNYTWIIRFEKGERLKETLEAFLINNNCTGGWVEAIGAAQDLELGYFNLEKVNMICKYSKDFTRSHH